MTKKLSAILIAYIKNQMEVTGGIVTEISNITADSREKTSHLGFLMHNLYCAIEDIFKEVARTFENRISDDSRFHRELLDRMKLNIPGVRKNLLSDESHLFLGDLRGFRHVFRHSYTYNLSTEKITILKKRLLEKWPQVQVDIEGFIEFLEDIQNS